MSFNMIWFKCDRQNTVYLSSDSIWKREKTTKNCFLSTFFISSSSLRNIRVYNKMCNMNWNWQIKFNLITYTQTLTRARTHTHTLDVHTKKNGRTDGNLLFIIVFVVVVSRRGRIQNDLWSSLLQRNIDVIGWSIDIGGWRWLLLLWCCLSIRGCTRLLNTLSKTDLDLYWGTAKEDENLSNHFDGDVSMRWWCVVCVCVVCVCRVPWLLWIDNSTLSRQNLPVAGDNHSELDILHLLDLDVHRDRCLRGSSVRNIWATHLVVSHALRYWLVCRGNRWQCDIWTIVCKCYRLTVAYRSNALDGTQILPDTPTNASDSPDNSGTLRSWHFHRHNIWDEKRKCWEKNLNWNILTV